MAAYRVVEPAVFEESPSNIKNTSCCFCFPCFSSRRTPTFGLAFREWLRSAKLSSVGAVQKVREWSEMVAGPRWKTFIRRFNRNKSGTGGYVAGGRYGQFHYDPLSYALNFDEGAGQNGNFEDDTDSGGGFQAFSTRYASVSGSEKTALAPTTTFEVRKDVAVFA
ncbi:hypothetical protein PTKIN_Ptkin05aG0158100 [Pterospermum kingtungense]